EREDSPGIAAAGGAARRAARDRVDPARRRGGAAGVIPLAPSPGAILAPSSDAWVRAAIADLGTLLVDHAHCEKRAASAAVRYLFKYPDWPALLGAMSRLAREELVHFERVLKELEARGVPFRGLPSANYAASLFELVRSKDARARKVDELLCCALIEAR